MAAHRRRHLKRRLTVVDGALPTWWYQAKRYDVGTEEDPEHFARALGIVLVLLTAILAWWVF